MLILKNETDEVVRLPIIESDVREVAFEDRLSDLIGERYQSWKIGEIIFIHASTGLGKTYFILICLYEYAKRQNVEIVIIVNRRLLKEQIWEEVRKHDLKMNEREIQLHLFTYQELEGDGEQVEWKKDVVRRCRYIVCDECHYFLSDSTFNPGVQRSFDFITSLYIGATLIFLSATMSFVRPQIEKRVWQLYQQHVNLWENKRKRYEKTAIDDCRFKKNGDERSLGAFVNKLEEKEKSLKYQEDMRDYKEQMIAPNIREYQFFRDISANVEVRFFRIPDDIIGQIGKSSSSEKWLIFVSSKSIGQKMRENLIESGIDKQKVVYVDADYDTLRTADDSVRKEAQCEVSNIVKTGIFQCDVLITTAVLDNGVNICDNRVKNIVLLTDDRVEFQQMLGRKRFTCQDERLNLFICTGDQSIFRKRSDTYFRIYWAICEKRELSLPMTNEMLLKEPFETAHFLKSYFTFDGCKYYGNELALEAIRRKQLYCSKVEQGLMNDENFFLKEQLEWLGIEYTKEWKKWADISVSQEEIDEIQRKLQDLYDAGGVIDKETFSEFGQMLMKIVAKIDSKNFSGKSGSITTVEKALGLREEWCDFQIRSFGDRKTYYEILLKGKAYSNFPVNFTLDTLKKLVEDNSTGDMCEIYRKLFKTDVPQCLADDTDSLQIFLNNKLKNHPGLEGCIIKSSGKGKTRKFVVGKRPNSTLA